MSETPEWSGSSRRPKLKRKVDSPILFDPKHSSQSKSQSQEPVALDLGYTHTHPHTHLHPHLPRAPTPKRKRFVPFQLLCKYVYSTRRALSARPLLSSPLLYAHTLYGYTCALILYSTVHEALPFCVLLTSSPFDKRNC